MKTVLIDNGHGCDTQGKQSPNGDVREYKITRIIANKIASKLLANGYNAIILVPEETDIPLEERVYRANTRCRKFGVQNCILISIHCNAAGNGKEWKCARGVEAYTTIGDTKADELAEYFYNEFSKISPETKLRKDTTDEDSDKESNFYILRKTLCPAILTENFFMDNKEDAELLQDEKVLSKIADAHVRAILQYFSQ